MPRCANAMRAEQGALWQRKGQLLERSARQRIECLALLDEVEAVGAQWQQWRGAIGLGGVALGAGALLLGLLRPRRGLRWLGRLWLGWRGWLALRRRAAELLTELLAARRRR